MKKKKPKKVKQKKIKLTREEQEKLKQSELENILHETESLTPEQLENKNKDKEKEKIELTGGGTTSIKDIKDFVAANKQPYKTHFEYEKPFYLNIFKLNKWNENEHKNFVKPKEVATWTNRLIYGRFNKEVLKKLKKKNPILFAYIRKYKYFEFLNEEGQDNLDKIIDDFIGMTIGYDDWDKFEEDYCKKYKIDKPQKLF